jgi:hypothetical protein
MLSFTLKPHGSALKVQCCVYPSQREMLRAIRTDRRGGIQNDTAAFCATERAKMPRGFGAIVYLCKPYLTKGVVVHEFVHASLAILARRKIRNIPCTTEDAPVVEETLASLVEHLTDAFHKKYGV